MTNAQFEKIYRSYFGYVHLYLIRLCKDEDLAEELTCETFFKALSAIDNFQGKSNIGTWLCQIAKNCYFAYLKKHRNLADGEELDELTDAEADVEEKVVDADTSMNIYKAMNDIDEPYKGVFYLRVLEELSFRQIGEIYGKTENWACVTYHRGKQKIQRILEGKYEDFM